MNGAEDANIIEVETEPLSSYITRKIDLLKIDIEGVEGEVLKEIQPKLKLVDKLFIEYHSVDNKEGYGVHIKEAFNARHPFINIPVVVGMDNQPEIYASR